MFFSESRLRVFLCRRPTDMRKSFTGLSAMVKHVLALDPRSGHLFVFVNRRRNYFKALYFDRGGYCLWSKRLEQGFFYGVLGEGTVNEITYAQLKYIIEGLAVEQAKQYRRFELNRRDSPSVLR